MSSARIEHVNLTVRNLEATLGFIRSALPGWRIRGGGTMEWSGKTVRWLHVGDDDQYIALQDGGHGLPPAWDGSDCGAKHVGITVDSMDEIVARLAAAGYELDHYGGTGAHRRSVYFVEPGSIQFEFVEYSSELPAERNRYDG